MAHTRRRPKSRQSRPRSGSQILRNAQDEIDDLIHARQYLEFQIRKVLKTNRYLRDKLSDAGDCISTLESTERQLNDYIQKLITERDAATRRVKELEHIATTKRRPTPSTNNESRRLKRERTLETLKRVLTQQEAVPPPRPPLAIPTITVKVEEEQVDCQMTSDDEEQSVPGLPLVEHGLNKDVIEQLTELMKSRKGKIRLESFLERGERNKYFCAHRVLREGEFVSRPLLPSQACISKYCKNNFRVMVVDTTSGVKLQTAPYTPME